MNRQNTFASWSRDAAKIHDISDLDTTPAMAAVIPTRNDETPSFWRDRLVEAGLILSLGLYYLIGNANIHIPVGHSSLYNVLSVFLTHLAAQNPLVSLPFLLIFALLCWYRLPVALALLPLTLPYYLMPKTVYHTYRFSMVEIALWTCFAIACLQLLFKRRSWPYKLSWSEIRSRLGPFLLPLLVFFLAALCSCFIAYSRANALRAFREEVVGPLLFLGLALLCLQTRQDVMRLLAALLGTGLVIALLGMAQYFFFKNTITPDAEGLKRISTVYGSGNSIGLLFDYTLPVGLAFIVVARVSWWMRLLACALCLPFVFVLYLSSSRGAWIAVPIALLLVLACAVKDRRLLVVGGLLVVLLAVSVSAIFHEQVYDFVINGHTNQQNQNTAVKRPLLWLSAVHMIHDSPWLGYGMDNWLCHYSDSYYNPCWYPLPHEKCWHYAPPDCTHWLPDTPEHPKQRTYWITKDAQGKSTGMGSEPTLSHPHNIFLHVWVSIGVFGFLAFVAVLILFYWLFVRLLLYLRKVQPRGHEQLYWMTVGVGAALLAALLQGQVDSSFLEQDLAFCFWMLVSALLLLRFLAGMPWSALFATKRSIVTL